MRDYQWLNGMIVTKQAAFRTIRNTDFGIDIWNDISDWQKDLEGRHYIILQKPSGESTRIPQDYFPYVKIVAIDNENPDKGYSVDICALSDVKIDFIDKSVKKLLEDLEEPAQFNYG